MNSELKALVDVAFSLGAVAGDVIDKKSLSQDVVDAQPLVIELPVAFAGFKDLSAEIAALPGSAQEADLVAYIESKAGLAGKGASVLSAALAWGQASYNLYVAVKA